MTKVTQTGITAAQEALAERAKNPIKAKKKPKAVAKPAPTESSPEQLGRAIDEIIMKGDISSLTTPQRAEFLGKLALSMGLNPLSQPFELIVLNDKLTIYAKKGAADQLREKHKIKTTVLSKGFLDEGKTAYYVEVQLQTPDPNGNYDTQGCRSEVEIGCAGVGGSTGEALGNAHMKAYTKAKRRGTLAFCGFGGLDELEVDSITARETEKGGVGQPQRFIPRLSAAPTPAATAPPITIAAHRVVTIPVPGSSTLGGAIKQPVILPPIKPPVSTGK